ncbi:MAG TPA: FxsA family protein [Candidatus Anaerobiospirillum stercoravium]|nr:FxsA family protein [Candidatus Anaerobiospirillum stercoravium]
MGRIFIIFFLWVMLEIYTFVLVGDAIGYLWAILLIAAISFVGLKLASGASRRELMYLQLIHDLLGQREPNPAWSAAQIDQVKQRLAQINPSDIPAYINACRKRALIGQLVILLYVVPGFLTDIIATILLVLNLSRGLSQGSLFDHPIFEKMAGMGVFSRKGYSRYQAEYEAKYGKSDAQRAKEEAAAQEQARGDVPVYQGKQGFAKMREQFESEREVKDAQFEEIDDDTPKR